MSYESLVKKVFADLEHVDSSKFANYDNKAATLLNVTSDRNIVNSLNTMVEGVHFLSNVKACDLAYKALVSNYSKLMALGAEPICFQINISMPKISELWLEDFASGLRESTEKYGGYLTGVSLVTGKSSIAVSSIGQVAYDIGSVKNASPQVSDLIYVTGSLGDAGLALNRILQDIPNDDNTSRYLEKCLMKPEIPLKFAVELQAITTSCTEISAGLSQDLKRILTKSSLGAHINLKDIPLSEQIKAVIERNAAYQCAFTGADDYEICFTVKPENKDKLLELAVRYDCRLSCIGHLSAHPGMHVYDKYDEPFIIKDSDHDHFAIIDYKGDEEGAS